MILTVGEIVWDIIEGREVLGGAPLNVACRLSQLGQEVRMLSRLGKDERGRRTRARLAALNLSDQCIQTDLQLATGEVVVSFSDDQEPSYDIVYPAAWDAIERVKDEDCLGTDSLQVVFGTLAQRDPRSRETIRHYVKQAQRSYYDVNLRPPFTTAPLTLESLLLADVVKMNREELDITCHWAAIPGGTFSQKLQAIYTHFNLAALCVTQGGAGAQLLTPEGCFSHPGYKVEVVDTVGAGDAFFAALIDAMQQHLDWPLCLQRANRLGSLAASHRGAVSAFDPAVFNH